MGLKKELVRALHWAEKHGAKKVIDALEGVTEEGLDALAGSVPDEFKLLAKTVDSLAKGQLERLVNKLEAKLNEEDEVQETPPDEAA